MRKSQNATAPEIVDFKHICGLLSISTQKFYDLRNTGRFPVPAIRLGKSVRYNKRQVMNWIESGCSVNWRAR